MVGFDSGVYAKSFPSESLVDVHRVANSSWRVMAGIFLLAVRAAFAHPH